MARSLDCRTVLQALALRGCTAGGRLGTRGGAQAGAGGAWRHERTDFVAPVVAAAHPTAALQGSRCCVLVPCHGALCCVSAMNVPSDSHRLEPDGPERPPPPGPADGQGGGGWQTHFVMHFWASQGGSPFLRLLQGPMSRKQRASS